MLHLKPIDILLPSNPSHWHMMIEGVSLCWWLGIYISKHYNILCLLWNLSSLSMFLCPDECVCLRLHEEQRVYDKEWKLVIFGPQQYGQVVCLSVWPAVPKAYSYLSFRILRRGVFILWWIEWLVLHIPGNTRIHYYWKGVLFPTSYSSVQSISHTSIIYT